MNRFFSLIIFAFMFSVVMPSVIAIIKASEKELNEVEKVATENDEDKTEKEEFNFDDKLLPHIKDISIKINKGKNATLFAYSEKKSVFNKILFSPPPENF